MQSDPIFMYQRGSNLGRIVRSVDWLRWAHANTGASQGTQTGDGAKGSTGSFIDVSQKEAVVSAARRLEAYAIGQDTIVLGIDYSQELLQSIVACVIAGQAFCIIDERGLSKFLLETFPPAERKIPGLVVSSVVPQLAVPHVRPSDLLGGPYSGTLPELDYDRLFDFSRTVMSANL